MRDLRRSPIRVRDIIGQNAFIEQSSVVSSKDFFQKRRIVPSVHRLVKAAIGDAPELGGIYRLSVA